MSFSSVVSETNHNTAVINLWGIFRFCTVDCSALATENVSLQSLGYIRALRFKSLESDTDEKLVKLLSKVRKKKRKIFIL